MNERREWALSDALQVWSILLAYQNLFENREQNEKSDINALTEKQTQTLLEDVHKQFDKQNRMLEELSDYIHTNF